MTLPLIIPIGPNLPDDSLVGEIQNIELWESMNPMKLNLTKTGELVMRRKTRNPSGTIPITERKSELQLLEVTFHESPCNLDTHFHYMMSKAISKLYNYPQS